MSSKREALTALAALVAAAIPDAQFERNLTKPRALRAAVISPCLTAIRGSLR